ncbi:transcription antitermination factor NusG [Streptacidiphilus sp. MAP12-16]|uniref:KOW motif-containing protein n=1 Tax=Streptacidiphilus sp. MAP12-16 TaxID=3156300 RepID=UPI003513125C
METPELHVGDSVLVREGPFANLTGVVRFIDAERKRVGVVVLIFGDETLIDIPLPTVE